MLLEHAKPKGASNRETTKNIVFLFFITYLELTAFIFDVSEVFGICFFFFFFLTAT